MPRAVPDSEAADFTGVAVDTVLDPTLADNGGLTLTHALVAGSPAINAGDNSLATETGLAGGPALTTDQRGTGFDRIAAGTVDIGAFEFADFDFGDAPDFVPFDGDGDGEVRGRDPDDSDASVFLPLSPAPYPTTIASNGPSHQLGSGLFLGSMVDADPDGQPTGVATGDDTDGTDDDDGVVFSSLIPGQQTHIDVTASAAGLINAWIDYDNDGQFENGEQVFTDEPVVAGVNQLIVNVPVTASTGVTFARFRLDSAGGLAPTGPAMDGEVEDYAVLIGTLEVTTTNDGDSEFDSVMSLREAIRIANMLPDMPVEITFSDGTGGTHNFHDATPDVITLDRTQLAISSDITISGPGADLLTVSGDNRRRVFDIAGGNHDVTFDSLTIANGNAVHGGGIRNRSTATVTIVDAVVRDNTAPFGSGISHDNGALNVERTSIRGNTAIGYLSSTAGGGGVEVIGGSVTITDSTIASNRVEDQVISAFGGGIYVRGGELSVIGSTISDNSADGRGGGIHNLGTTTVASSTIFGNSSH